MSEGKTKQKTGNKIRNRQIRKDLKRNVNRSYYETIKIKRKRLDINNKEPV